MSDIWVPLHIPTATVTLKFAAIRANFAGLKISALPNKTPKLGDELPQKHKEAIFVFDGFFSLCQYVRKP